MALFVERLRMKDVFAYSLFTNYIIHPTFIEEFAFYLSDPEANGTLDIAPAVSSQRRMGTRSA